MNMLAKRELRVLADGLPNWLTVGKTVLRYKFNGKLYTLTSLGSQEWRINGKHYSQIKLESEDGDVFETNKYWRGERNHCRMEVARLFEDVSVAATGNDWVI